MNNWWTTISLVDYCEQGKRNKYFKKKIPELAGVYVFYFSSGKLYIGSTTNLKARLDSHCVIKKLHHEFDYITQLKYKVCIKYGYWLMLEARLIKKLQPHLNTSFIGKEILKTRGN